MSDHHHSHAPLLDRDKINPRYALLASFWAVGTAFILIGIKFYAYYVSDSVAMLGTLTDSVVDVAISLMMLFAVGLSLKPADKQHRFGHGKVEGIAALLQGVFMSFAGVFLAFEAVSRFIHPVELSEHKLGIIIAGIAILLSLILIAIQRFVLRRAPSLAIEADHAHYKTDVFLNGSVIVALLVNYYGGFVWLDSAFALLIAVYFLQTAWKITRKSLDMLMDKELPESIRDNIKEISLKHAGIHGMHDLRTRMSGMMIYISFDVEIDPLISLGAAHDIVQALEGELLKEYPNAEIIIHMDPVGNSECARHSVKGVHH